MSGAHKKPKLVRKYLAGQDLVLRWHLCQLIAKQYYESTMNQTEVERTLNFFKQSDILNGLLPSIEKK